MSLLSCWLLRANSHMSGLPFSYSVWKLLRLTGCELQLETNQTTWTISLGIHQMVQYLSMIVMSSDCWIPLMTFYCCGWIENVIVSCVKFRVVVWRITVVVCNCPWGFLASCTICCWFLGKGDPGVQSSGPFLSMEGCIVVSDVTCGGLRYAFCF